MINALATPLGFNMKSRCKNDWSGVFRKPSSSLSAIHILKEYISNISLPIVFKQYELSIISQGKSRLHKFYVW